MKLSTKVEYGLISLVDIAVHSQSGDVVTVISIAERQNISKTYLEQILTPLRIAGIITATKGSQGGYTLADHPKNIRVSDILNALDRTLLSVTSDGDSKGDPAIVCALKQTVWDQLDNAFSSIANQTTLQDLMDAYSSNSGGAIMFYI